MPGRPSPGRSASPPADQVVTDWPHRYLAAEAAAGRLDARTVVCVLTHDPKFDIPLLQTALGLDLAYVGAMGSRRSHGQRLDSLLAAGVAPEDLEPAAFAHRAGPRRRHPGRGGRLHHRGAGGSRNRSARGLSLKHGSGPIHRYGRPDRPTPVAPIPQPRTPSIHTPLPAPPPYPAPPGDAMDMNTIEAVVRTADPADWQAGDAWLAGGTVLFSYGSFAFGKEPLRRLLDLGSTGWPAITVSDSGIELAATCTVAELYALPAGETGRAHAAAWPALELIRPCCDSFVASFKVWNMSTVGGNLCTSLPAGPMISLCAALDGVATVLGPGGASRTVPVAEFVTGDGRNCLAPGELLRSVHLPASALASPGGVPPPVAEQPGTVRGAADREARRRRRPGPHRHRRHQAPRAAALRGLPHSPAALAGARRRHPGRLYHDDIHGLPAWRRDMTYRLAEEIRAELAAPAGTRRRPAFPATSGRRRAPAPHQRQASPQQEGA